jgi:V/A-type H+/Na+-transporting ATPase subunit I
MFAGKSDILLKMLRPERMTSTSIICVKKDVEQILESLNIFGEFHIEQTAQDNAGLSEYNVSIQKVEESLADVNVLINQLVQEKSSPLGIFKLPQQNKIQVTAENWQALLEATGQKISVFKKETDSLNEEISCIQEKTEQLNFTKDMLGRLSIMDVDLAAMEELKLIYVATASVPTKNFSGLETALAGLPIFINRCALTKEVSFVCLAIPTKYKAEIEKILRTYHAEVFHIPKELPHDLTLAQKEVNKQLKENTDREKALCTSLKKLGEENKDTFASLKETSENILTLLQAERNILQSGRLATVKGFVPQKKFHELKESVSGMMDGKVLVLENDVVETQNPPTKVSNNRFVRPFGEITKLYGLPHYGEVDPTPLMAITFPIIFGLMFGDLGHGLVLLFGGLIVGLLIKGNRSIKNVCYIMAACGAAASVAGLVFGEAFGKSLPWGPLWINPTENPAVNVFTFLIFSLSVGIIQIISGIVLEMSNFALKHQYIDSILTSAPKIAFYLGGVYLIAVYQLNFGAWFAGPILLPLIPFIVLIVGKPLYLLAAKPKSHHGTEHAEQDTFSGRLFEGGDLVTRLLSNTISYSRILGLLMAHWALLLVTYTIADLVNPSSSTLNLILAGIVIVGGNIFVLALEGLIVFIHTLRLHFYEWFSKFYLGTGIEFNPFKQKFNHTNMTLKRKDTAKQP